MCVFTLAENLKKGFSGLEISKIYYLLHLSVIK